MVERLVGRWWNGRYGRLARPPLTMDDLLAGYDNPDWGGFGYLGERQHALNSGEPVRARVKAADELVVKVANDRGWTAQDLFDWSTSRPGRWYGVAWFGDDDEARQAQSVMDNLVNLDLAEVRV